MTDFTTCDTYNDLNISPGCTDEACSRLFILCENGCINEGQEAPTAPVCPSIYPMPSDSPMATELGSGSPTPITNISLTPAKTTVTITASNISTVRQSSCIMTSIILSTTTKIKEIPTTITVTTTTTTIATTWSPCPQRTMEPAVMQEPSQNKFSETFTLIKSTPSQPVTLRDKTNTSTTSSSLDTGSCIQPGTSTLAQGTSSSNATSGLGVLFGISLVLLTLVTVGWVWTCWTTNKKRESNNTSQNISSNTDFTTINSPDVSLDNNPAYETQTPLQKNIAYEDTTLHTDVPQRPSTQEPTYKIIPAATSANSVSEQMLISTKGGEEYDRLNREPPNS